MKIIYDLLSEVRDDQKKHGEELAKQSVYLEKMDGDIRKLEVNVAKNTDDVAHHIRRTDSLQELYGDNQVRIKGTEDRLDKLEEPVKAKAWIKAHLISICSALAAIASIIALVVEKTK